MAIKFSSSDTECMYRAMLEAWQQLATKGLLQGETEAMAKAMLAKSIVEASERGESDEQALIAYALANYAAVRQKLGSAPELKQG